MRLTKGTLTIASLLLASAAYAAQAETLEQAWSLAIARDRALAAASSDLEGAKATEQAARGARWPSFDATAGYTRLDASPTLDVVTPAFVFRSGPIFNRDEFVAGTVQMRLPLYTGGQVSAVIDAAHGRWVSAAEDEHATASRLKLEVAEAYVEVLRARRFLGATIASVDSLTAHAADVQHMMERDLVPKSDLLAARVTLADAEQTRVRAVNTADSAQADYNRRLGEPQERPVELDGSIPADASLAGTALAVLVQRAQQSRSELKAQAARAGALESQARAETGKRLPQLGLTAAYTHLDNTVLDRENVATVGIGITWSLFDGGQARNRAAALRSASHAAQSRVEDLRSRIELEVRQAWLAVQDAQARLKSSVEAVSQAAENLRSSRELYGAGLATNTQVLDAVSLQIRATSNRDNATLDESLALIRLEYAVGDLQ